MDFKWYFIGYGSGLAGSLFGIWWYDRYLKS